MQSSIIQLASEILKWLGDSVSACKKEPCKLVYLRAFKNAGSPSTTVPLMLNILRQDGGQKTSKAPLAAVKTLQSLLPFDAEDKNEVERTLMSIFRWV